MVAGEELLALERALADRDADGLEEGLLELLSDDFVEFGRSGTVWTRASIAPLLEAGPSRVRTRLEAFEVHELADGVVLVTYRAAGALRSSVWVRPDGRWRLRFHQGTPLPEVPAV